MRNLFTTVGILIATTIFSQDIKICSTTEAQNEWFAQHPDLRVKFEQLQNEASAIDKELYKTGYKNTGGMEKGSSAANYTIPVVFHIIHTGGPENISDAQVNDAVAILTRDYNKMNADTSNVVTQFKNKIGDVQIDFVLAKRDPQGNCTNGIIRHWNTSTDWTSGSFSKYIYSWPSNKYLNIYVVKTINSGAAGYTYLPGSGVPSPADAIVALSSYVGSIGTSNVNKSRTLTHEVGHWLNLPHVWGGTNQPGVSCGDEGVSDTPVTKGFNSCQLTNAAVCNPSIVENVQNYMDYSYCTHMFTTGQASRMQLALNSPVGGRNNLSSSNNLIATGVTNPATNCVTLLDIVSNATTICTGMTANLTSYTSNATPTSFSWSTNGGGIITNPTAANTSITFTTVGTNIVTCEVFNAGGSTIKTVTVEVVNGSADISSVYSESFEDPSLMLPPYWQVYSDQNSTIQWEPYPYAAATGSVCMYLAAEGLAANSVEILETPAFDFKNNQGAKFTFKYAYAKHSIDNKDLFKIQASKNCGGTWTDIYVPSNSTMAQGSGGVTSSTYLMPLSNEWKFYDLTAHPAFNNFKNEDNVKIRFYFQEDVGGSGYGNRIYLEDINFGNMLTVGVNELTRSIGLNLYPNPANSQFNLSFTLSDASDVSYKVLSVSGAEMMSKQINNLPAGTHEIALNADKQLSSGIYIVQMELNGVKMSRKLVLN
jgi:PKD repeat protein